MGKPVRLQRLRSKGFDLQAFSRATNGLPAVYVGRPTKWGNPFKVGEEYVRRKMQAGGGQSANTVQDNDHAVRLFRRFTAREVRWQEAVYQELRGKNLACWCPLDAACHADVLLELANA